MHTLKLLTPFPLVGRSGIEPLPLDFQSIVHTKYTTDPNACIHASGIGIQRQFLTKEHLHAMQGLSVIH